MRVQVYLIGFLLGVVLLMFLPLPRPEKRERPAFLEREAPAAQQPVAVTDARGREVALPRPPRRLISLAPSITESLFALRAGELIVGRTDYCTVPAEAVEIPSLGSLTQPSPEQILALRPHLVLATSLTPPSTLERLEQLGLPTFVLRAQDWDGVVRDFHDLARLLGAPGEALRVLHDLDQRRGRVIAAMDTVRHLPPRRTLLLYSVDQLTSAAPGTWIGDLLAVAHAENLAGGSGSAWPRLQREAVIARDPEVILISAPEDPALRRALEARLLRLATDPLWSPLTAVRNGRVVLLDEGPLQIPGPRIGAAQEAVARAIWPEAF